MAQVTRMGAPSVARETLIMGVLNVTPDSFSDGGKYSSAEAAVAHAREMAAEGAHIVDVGGESSRPGAEPLDPNEEQGRVLPVIEQIAAERIPISIDTYHADTARRALSLGAGMVNDITALRGDPGMAEVVAEAACTCVLMHMLGTPRTMQRAPRYNDVVDDICRFFDERIRYATKTGIREEAIWLDPGFGFGKTPAHNLEILRRLSEFKKFGRPILIGTSNKSTIGEVLGVAVDDRMEGTAATVAIAIAHGADAVRVHDVKRMARVAKMTDAIVRGTYSE
ncbi:MAG: dihydropteroate synthase [Candidatus Hydrogenedentes bacterium]|nr:dihydropteroate synthase [Candidatus Hydrogenedentota bacterium]